jgi:hypothetical protein
MTHHVSARAEIAATPEAIFARISDHERTPTWISQVRSVRLVEDGAVHNGVGAVRVVAFKPLLWTTIHERIVRFEPARGFHYVLFRGMPGLVNHLGKLEIDPGSPCVVRWEVDFAFAQWHPFRPFVPSFLREFQGVMQAGLDELARQLTA